MRTTRFRKNSEYMNICFESWSLTSNIITLSQLYHKLIIAQCFIYAQWKYVVLIPIVLKTYCTDMLHCTITCLNLWLHIRDHILTHAYYTHKISIRVQFIAFKKYIYIGVTSVILCTSNRNQSKRGIASIIKTKCQIEARFGITFIRYTESRKIGEPNYFRFLHNFTVVYCLECKCYIYLRCASFPLITTWNT